MTEKSKTRWDHWKTPLEIVAVLAAIVGIIWGAGVWIDARARDAVKDEKFLAELSAKVRPTCIFTSAGAIEADMGAADYIEDIKVKFVPAMYGFEIDIKMKRHLAYAPIVSGLDVSLFPETVKRGPMHSWNFRLTPATTSPSIYDAEGIRTNVQCRFKVEILH